MCPNAEILSAYHDGEIHEPFRSRVARHVEGCPACAASVAALAGISQALKSDPEPDFSTSAARVLAAVESHDPFGRSRRAGLHYGQRFWQRQLNLPLPAAAVIAFLIIGTPVASVLLSRGQAAPSPALAAAPALPQETDSVTRSYITPAEFAALRDSVKKTGDQVTITLPEGTTITIAGGGDPKREPALVPLKEGK